MKAQFKVPAQTVSHEISQFRLTPEQPNISVAMKVDNRNIIVGVDVYEVLNDFTAKEKDAVERFFVKASVLALTKITGKTVKESELSGEIFAPEEEPKEEPKAE